MALQGGGRVVRIVAGIFLLGTMGLAQSVPPRIFFSDLTSGPNTGGQNNKGAFVTVWGRNFGTSRGTSTVTIGGGLADNYPVWTDTKIVFQLGASAATGNIVVATSTGSSNGVPFTIRAGNIYFVATGGNDNNNGSYATPWGTIANAKDSIAAGDIAYILNGVAQTAVDNYNASLAIVSGGTTAAPKALVAYPGATATVGTNSLSYAIRTPAVSGGKDYWVISGLTLRGQSAVDLVGVTGWRVVGNDMSCPNGSGQAACFHTDTTTQLKFLGNYVHNVGDAAGSIDKYFHAVYFTTNSNSIEAAWNTVVPNPNKSTTSGGCRAIQFYSTGGADQYDLHVHDNLVHDAICDGINFATVNPTQGTVEAYNNVVYHVGTGPDPGNGASNYACLLTGSGAGSSTAVQVYNNTFYDCGLRGTSDSGAVTLYTPTNLRNNVIYQLSGEKYVGGSGQFNNPTGNNNLWFGVGSAPTSTTTNYNSDPLFVGAASANFRIQATSPAKDVGVTIASLTTDFDGTIRPQGSAFDLGAFEYYQGSGTVTLTCDLNGDGTVNITDVSLALNQVLGSAPCNTADLNQDGVCDVRDLQRFINAAQGQACKVGP